MILTTFAVDTITINQEFFIVTCRKSSINDEHYLIPAVPETFRVFGQSINWDINSGINSSMNKGVNTDKHVY